MNALIDLKQDAEFVVLFLRVFGEQIEVARKNDKNYDMAIINSCILLIRREFGI
ncbi:hypothetical protein AEP_01725 [Curvibacter sp. AEP1-3]|nr:hypothetical protein AEP_01725 [Curvibacter sp. AEP1-3]